MKRRYRSNQITETDIEEYLINKVKGIGGICPKGNPHNQRGMHDRICILPRGLTVFVEVKRPGRKPRPNQRLMNQRLIALGHHAVWANTYGMVDKLINWMRLTMATKKVVGADYICHRPDCDRRVKEAWINYLESINS